MSDPVVLARWLMPNDFQPQAVLASLIMGKGWKRIGERLTAVLAETTDPPAASNEGDHACRSSA